MPTRRVPRAYRSPAHLLEQLEPRQMMVADPVTTNHPIWYATYGTPMTDGVIKEAEWAGSTPIVRAQPNQYNSSITVRYMYNERGIFVGVEAKDDRVWADGGGNGLGNRWEFGDDDGFGMFFDPTNARKRFLQPSGRFFGTNLGKLVGPFSGTGVVTRIDYLAGDGAGGGTNVNVGGVITPGMRWKSRIYGTPNNNADVDTGWSIEYFMPWSTIGMASMPQNGQFIGANFQAFFDNTGGTRDFANAGDFKDDVNRRFGARIIDDEVQGVHSSFAYTNSGFEGPINYAQLVFINPYVSDSPRGIANLTVNNISGYGARLDFSAPAVSQIMRGSASAYEIRLSIDPIVSEDDWEAAEVVRNTFVPRIIGQRESLRIGDLYPEVTYHVAVRAADPVGRLGPIVTQSFTTLTEEQDTSFGERLLVSPDGGQLVTEAGDAFVINGSHAVVNTRYLRNLYPGDIWNPNGQNMVNFGRNPGGEGDASGYFDALASYGINTLRVPLEWLPLQNTAAARANLPAGNYWIESTPGVFNPDMHEYLHNMINEASRVGIRLILHPFSTFNFKSFFELTPYARVNGGPLDTIDDFFQNMQVLDMVVNRINTVIDWVNDSDFPQTVIGIEPVNEWDSTNWTRNARGDTDSARTVEMRDRAKFMVKIGQRVHQYSPNTLLLSTGNEVVPRGAIARAVFESDAFDMLAPHLYTTTTSEPINNPDSDKSIRAAIDYAGIAQYWVSNRRDNRPIHNGEWGLTSTQSNWPGNRTYYTGVSPGANTAKPWTVQQDADLYRTTAWASIASGFAGAGLRLGGAESRDLIPADISPETTGYLPIGLSTQIRQVQRSINSFMLDDGLGFEWDHFDPVTLAGRMTFGGVTPRTLLSFGVSDGMQGLAYLLKSQTATRPFEGASMSITGLAMSGLFSVEVWSTGSTGADSELLTVIDGLTPATGGRITFDLPTFTTDVMIKFRAW